MDTLSIPTKPGRPVLNKISMAVLFTVLILGISVLIFLYFFLKSPLFLRVIESGIKDRFRTQLEIGSLSFSETHGIMIHDLTLFGEGDRKPLAIILQAEVAISVPGIIRRRIDSVTIKGPRIFINLQKDKKDHGTEKAKQEISIPVSFKKASLENGEVILELDGGLTYHIRSVTLSLEQAAFVGPSIMKGEAFVQEFNSTVSFQAGMDMKKLNPENVHLDIGPMDLAALVSGHADFLKDKELEGTLRLSVDILNTGKEMDIRVKGGIEGLRVSGDQGRFSFIDGSGEVNAHLEMARENFSAGDKAPAGKIRWESDLLFSGLLVSSGSLNPNLIKNPLRLQSNGTYDIQADHLNLEFLKAAVGPLKPWTLQGSVARTVSGDPEMDLHLDTGAFPLSDLEGILRGREAERLDSIGMNGEARAEIDMKGSLASPVIQGVLSLHNGNLRKQDIEVGPFEITVPFEYREHGVMVREAMGRADKASLGPGKGKGMACILNNLELTVSEMTVEASKVRSSGFRIQAGRGVVYKDGKTYHEEQGISLSGGIEGDLDKKALRLSKALINTKSFQGVSAEASLNWGKQMTLDASAAYANLDLEKVRAGLPQDFSPLRGFSVKGKGALSTSVEMTSPEGAPVRINGRAELNLKEGGFSSPDGDKVGEGITMKLSGGFRFALPFQKAEFTLDAEASDFELLLGAFYGSFKERTLSLSAAGGYNKDTDVLDVSRADLGLTDIGALGISGRVSNITGKPLFDAQADLARLSNKTAYNFFVRETFQESYPFLSQLELDGLTTARLSAKGSQERYHISGEMEFRDLDIRGKENRLDLTGIDMRLPVDITYPEASSSEETEKYGFLRFKRLSWRALEIKGIEVSPTLWRNTFMVKGGAVLPVFGGEIRLKEISYQDILSPERRMLLSMNINTVDLAQMSVALGLPRFSGNLSGTIPHVTYAGSRLLTEGEIVLELFGGEVRVRAMSADNLFSPIVSLHSSIEFKEIDLGRLTDTFEFGHVSGVIQGSIEDLVITNGQAESFSARVETVKTKNVDQRIDVKALEKITILGSGGSPSILGQGIYQLFKEYRYAKMGFRCSLRNDNFELHGIEVEGEREYLVKGGLLPPKVNVINYTRHVSFRDMVKRLKRVQQAGEAEKQ
ncbi:MAG: hypothetical protein AABY87_11800 [bacterium]